MLTITGGYGLELIAKNIDGEQMKELQMMCDTQDYERLGPSVFRFIQKTLTGYKRFCDSDVPIQQARAGVYEGYCKLTYPLYDIGIKCAPNDHVAGIVTDLRDEVYSIFGKPKLRKVVYA